MRHYKYAALDNPQGDEMSIFSKVRSVFSNGALAKTLISAAVKEAKPAVEATIKSKLAGAGFTVPDEVIDDLLASAIAEVSAKLK